MTACIHHKEAAARWACSFCTENLCEACVEAGAYRGEEIKVCKECGARVASLSRPREPKAEPKTEPKTGPRATGASEPRSSASNPASSVPDQQGSVGSKIQIEYLWSGEGVLLLPMLAVASLALGFAPEFLSWMPIAGWFYIIAKIIVWTWVLGVGIEIIRGSLAGEERLSFQDNLVSGDGLWQRQGPWATLVLIGFGPVFLYPLLCTTESPSLPILLSLLLWKDLYVALALPSFTYFSSWASILPTTCMRDMFRLGSPFLGLVAACFGLSLATYTLTTLISLWSGPTLAEAQTQFLFFVAFILKMRWIGLFYRRHMQKLHW